MIPLGIVGLILAIGMVRYANNELSIVKISTAYGTLELSEDFGVTLKEDITQTIKTIDGYPYTEFKLDSGASTVSVTGIIPLDVNTLPVGTQSGHELIITFDDTAYTEEALFFDTILKIDGVRWDQVTIYSGQGQQLKVYQPAPQYDTGRFFTFFYQNEIERNGETYIFQFKGFDISSGENVYITLRYVITYSYIQPRTTTTTGTDITGVTTAGEPDRVYLSPSPSLLYIISFLMITILIRKRRQKKDEIS